MKYILLLSTIFATSIVSPRSAWSQDWDCHGVCVYGLEQVLFSTTACPITCTKPITRAQRCVHANLGFSRSATLVYNQPVAPRNFSPSFSTSKNLDYYFNNAIDSTNYYPKVNRCVGRNITWHSTTATFAAYSGRSGTWTGDGYICCTNIGAPLPNQGSGDMNCDGQLSFDDYQLFLKAVEHPEQYVAAMPSCNFMNADMNKDGSVDWLDIQAFTDALNGINYQYGW